MNTMLLFRYVLNLVLCAFLSFSTLGYSQENSVQDKVESLKATISQTKGSAKLKLLDSLSNLIRYKSEYKFDSIVKATIGFAIGQDSMDLASKHMARYIFYLANRAGEPKRAVEVFDEFISKDLSAVNPLTSARLYLNGADGYFFSGQTFESIDYYKKSSEYALEANDSVLMGKSKIYMSDAYADSGKFAEAGSILSKAEEIFESKKDTLNLLTTYNSRANLYSRLNFLKEAQQVRKEIIELALKRKDYRMLQSTYYNIAIDNGEENNLSQRVYNLSEALKYARLGDFKSYEMRILIALLQAHSANKNLIEANIILNIINEHPLRPKDRGLDDFHYTKAVAEYHFALGEHRKVISLGKSLLKMDSKNDFSNSMVAHNILSKAYENIGNSKDSYKHYKLFSKIRDSINSIQKVRSLTYYQTLYETKKRDATIDSQKSEIALLDAQNKIKKYWMLFGGIGLSTLFLIIYLIRSRKFATSKQKMQEQFSQDLITEQEKERAHLARELHDSVGQKLMLLSKQTKNLGDANMENLADITLDEIRSISRGLHPSNLERLGLTGAINVLVYNINANTDLFFTDEIDNIDNLLSKEAELHLYRIIQESLSNIVKHADAKAVKMDIKKTKGYVEVVVSDNGKGFDFETQFKNMSLGLKTLFERAKIMKAQINFNSSKGTGTGTEVTLTIPI